MDAIREQLNKPVVAAAASFLLGTIVGLVILGWWLWPVQWQDAGPQHLRVEFKEIYLRMAINSYTLNQDPVAAQQRIAEVGDDALSVLQAIQLKPGRQDASSIAQFVSFAQAGAVITPVAGVTEAAGTPVLGITTEGGTILPGTPPAGVGGVQPTDEAAGGDRSLGRSLLVFMCVVTLLLGAGLLVAFLLRNNFRGFSGFSGLSTKRRQPRRQEPMVQAHSTEAVINNDDPPVAQFMKTYTIGSDLFEEAFNIDSPKGEYLGDCGVGISETIGVGEPKRVTALEVWLFDNEDIRTVTNVIMSSYAFNDDNLRQNLANRGEPILAQPGREWVMETATLQVLARIVDLSYGQGVMPPDSYFDRLAMEFTVWAKV